MTGERANKVVATEYREGPYYLTQMGDDTWSIYTGPNGSGREMDGSFRTLRAARARAKELPGA